MESYLTILKRVGLVLIVLGAVDIVYKGDIASQSQDHIAAFDVFTLTAGVYLLQGGLGAARWVTFFAALILVAFVCMACSLALFQPAGPWVVGFRFHSLALSISIFLTVLRIALIAWIYKQLRSPPVVSARAAAGQTTAPPILAFAIGASLAVLLAVLMHATVGGARGAKAMELANAKYGSGYQYYVTSTRSSGGHVWARLTAYNDREEKPVQVDWEQ